MNKGRGSAECLLEQGLPIYFKQTMTKLKTVEVWVKATFKTEQKGTLLTYPFCQ